MLTFYTTWKHQKTTDILFLVHTEGNIDPKWVTQQQYRQERHNLMLLVWNVSSLIVNQNNCKNKTTWITNKALSKSFSLFHTTYIEDIKDLLKGLLFCSKPVWPFYNIMHERLNKK